MLKKLLKYDYKSVFKYWWIAAISSLLLSIVGGGCVTVFTADKQLPSAIYVIAVLILIVVILGYVAFSLLTVILIFARFYKNFFTDEGYLTFTLPVKRSQLLNSKLIMSTVAMFATSIVCVLNVLVVVCIGLADEIFTHAFFLRLRDFIKIIVEELGMYCVIYVLELLFLFVLYIIFSNLFMFCCITFASIITKKAKVVTAIGIYYGANSIFSFVVQMFYLFGMRSLASWLTALPTGSEHPVMTLILLGVILFIAVFCVLLYTLQYWMIDRKLNLS